METMTVRNVNDMQGDKKAALEGLLGQELRDGQQVFIMVFTPGAVPDDETRRVSAVRIAATLDAAEEQAAERSISAAQSDAAVDEAMHHVRPRRP
jgi:hypothetical protein